MGRAIARMCRAIGRGILLSIVFILRRWLPLLISVILGVGVAYLFKTTTPSMYTADMVLRTNSVPASEIISYINRLHTFCRENNFTALADVISIPQKDIKNISDISAFWIIDNGRDGVPDLVDYSDSHNIYDTINVRMQDRLDIRVKINVPQELSRIKNGIINFINADSLFQQRNRLRLSQNREMLARINYDILQLDSLQKFKYFEETKNMQPKNGGQMIFLQEHNTQLVYPDIHTLYQKKQAFETDLDLYKELTTTLSEFSIPVKRVNGGAYYAVKIVPIFFILTLLILIILANRKKLEEVYKKY
ncbi:MAG: hypothetical protein ABSA76_07115 [Bacteroidales bacterium]